MDLSLSRLFEDALLQATGASSYQLDKLIQPLWSGYGQIRRVKLYGTSIDSVVLKLVQPPSEQSHPRGWASDRSHQRKLRSYQIESHWYQAWSGKCDSRCRIPHFLDSVKNHNEQMVILEDLDGSGYAGRRQHVSREQVASCLRWLAEFHATFLGESPTGLWQTGTYWHLDTRPDELAMITDEKLKAAAAPIDRRLTNARFQTFVHGDAKLANFCFSETTGEVAAVDFQYVGGGAGIKDVAYFLGSCLSDDELEQQSEMLLDDYFQFLTSALNRRQPQTDVEAVIDEWRELFPWAWTDFHRFLAGWAPRHWKINSFSERIAREIVNKALYETQD